MLAPEVMQWSPAILHCVLTVQVPLPVFKPQTLAPVSQTPLVQPREPTMALQVPPGTGMPLATIFWQTPAAVTSLHHLPMPHWASVEQLVLHEPSTLQNGVAIAHATIPEPPKSLSHLSQVPLERRHAPLTPVQSVTLVDEQTVH